MSTVRCASSATSSTPRSRSPASRISIEASIGYVVAPDDGDDVDDLLQRADVAMYSAKRDHGGVVRYDAERRPLRRRQPHPAGRAAAGHRRRRARPALPAEDRSSRDGSVHAVEALVRWQHPVLGLLPPDRFLPLAEQTDLIDKLTEWVLARALADVVELGSRRPPISSSP